MMSKDEQFEKLQEILGPNFTKTAFENLRNEMALRENIKGNGASGFTAATLSDFLPQIAEGTSASATKSDEFVEFREDVKEEVRFAFDAIPPLSRVTAFKWLEVLVEFFSKYDKSQVILTTRNYMEADFDRCELTWGFRTFQGSFSIRNAARIVDRALLDYLCQKKLIPEYIYDDRNTRNLWLDINGMADPLDTDPIEQYLDDALEFTESSLQHADYGPNPFGEVQHAYQKLMATKYDKIFVSFMEQQGISVFLMYDNFRRRGDTEVILKTLAAHHAEYRQNPEPFAGLRTFIQKLKQYGFKSESDSKRRRFS
ncbi:hypothetical protein JCM33374_g5043 [Metschnikowia sp. JCM 33374]|nr:hypothetical protein JCM33374_g5043 [Metschnikowia sp. JCM 33374]